MWYISTFIAIFVVTIIAVSIYSFHKVIESYEQENPDME